MRWRSRAAAVGSTLGRFWRDDVGRVVAPPRCLRCLATDSWFCLSCLQHTVATPVRLLCIGCERDSRTGRTCPRCRPEVPLAGVVAAGSYHESWVQRGVGWLKFRGIKQLAEPLASVLAARIGLIAPVSYLRDEAVLVPIPLHPRRLRARGYNQSRLVAEALSAITGIPMVEALARQTATVPQSQLSARWRGLNVAEAFRTAAAVPQDRSLVLIIDDVITTGATLAAAARALRPPEAASSPTPALWGAAIGRGL